MADLSCLELTGRVLLVLLLASGTIKVVYYWFVFSRFAFSKKRSAGTGRHPVSVIVCARNEVRNLRKHLPVLLQQDHPDYEVILVNDCSFDDTEEFLKEFAPAHPRLKVVTIQEQERYSHGKKFALTLGIKAAKNDRLLFTDADCWPVSEKWISSMTACFRDDIEIVLGYGGYDRRPGLLNKLIRFDTSLIAMQYFSFALMGNAYMGVGRNLAYRKTLFFRNKGFARHNHLASGDDDLLVNETATTKNVEVNISPESFTRSIPKSTLGDWLRQKRRHMTTSGQYKAGHRWHLGLLACSGWMLQVSFIASIVLWNEVKVAAMAYGCVWLLIFPVVAASASRLQEKDVLPLHLVLEPLHSLLIPLPYLAQVFSKKRAWK